MSKSFPGRGGSDVGRGCPRVARSSHADENALQATHHLARPEPDEPTMASEPTPSLYATGRTSARLRAEIEAGTGLAFAPARLDAVGAICPALRPARRLL